MGEITMGKDIIVLGRLSPSLYFLGYSDSEMKKLLYQVDGIAMAHMDPMSYLISQPARNECCSCNTGSPLPALGTVLGTWEPWSHGMGNRSSGAEVIEGLAFLHSLRLLF